MRIIVHVGMAKAGSTTLQTSLANSLDFLLDRGVLYPRLSADHGHSLLAPIVSSMAEPFLFARGRYGNGKDLSRLSRRYKQAIRRQIEKAKPKVLILSSEYLSSVFCYSKAAVLNDILGEWSKDVDIIVYVREPRSLYTSSLQQTLKFNSEFKPPDQHSCNYRPLISHYENSFPGRVHIVPFEFQKFEDGCMVTDFLSRFLPDVCRDGMQIKVTKENVSPSCETTWIVRNYRETNFPGYGGKTVIQAYYLGIILDKIAADTQQWNKAQLTNAAQMMILAQNREDLLWLKEERGIQFSLVDYERLEKMDATVDHDKTWRLEDVLSVDVDLARRLECLALHQLISDSKNFRLRQARWLLGRARRAFDGLFNGF